MLKLHTNYTGDTIVEVLMAIAVAAFAIGTSYALANRSLQHAIAARDRNEAINYIDNQIVDLKERYNVSYFQNRTLFNNNFTAGVSGPPYPAIGKNFCLIDGATDPTKSGWLPKSNTIATNADLYNYAKYDSNNCVRGTTTKFYINIMAEITAVSQPTPNPTVYKVTVTWDKTDGTSGRSQAVVYYRF